MPLTEKKYRVEEFAHIEKLLKKAGAKEVKHVTSTHYYGEHEGNDVEKFVVYPDRVEIHVLKESEGKFALTESKLIAGKEEGFVWLKNRGYTKADVVDMDYTEYEYKNGIVGLYIIDDYLFSVVLSFPAGQHEQIEKDFGLETAEVIRPPYNKYLASLDRLRARELSSFIHTA